MSPHTSPSIRSFNLICSIAGLLFLLISQGAKWVQYDRRGLAQTQDFDQYYMGGVIARHGAWDALYPIPKPGALMNPGEPENSDLRPRYAELARQYRSSEYSTRYMQPPPSALLFVPLTFLPVKTAHVVWLVLLCLATWAIALQAAHAYEVCSGRRDRVAGLLILFVCLSPQAGRWVRVGNMSVIVGWLIGYAALAIAQSRQGVGPAIAMAIGALTKYVTLVLAPLHLAARQWRTLIWSAAIALVLLAISLAFTGFQPYRIFTNEIAPTLGRTVLKPANVSLEGVMCRLLGVEQLPTGARTAFQVARFSSLALILFALLRPGKKWNQPIAALATACALVAWMLIFSPILWEHYIAYLAPFWGWLAWEAIAARGQARIWLRPAIVIALALAWFPQKLIDGRHLPEPINAFLLWSTMLTTAVALRRMLTNPIAAAESPTPAHRESL